MKVVLIYRKFHPEAFSIEGLFKTIGFELEKHVQVIPYVAGSRLNAFADAWHLRQLKADVYHITGDINYLACLLPRKKTVLTLHDIVHYLYDLKGFKQWLYKYIWFIFPIWYCAQITTISETTKKNIIEYFRVRKIIHVIPNCYNPSFVPAKKAFNENLPKVLQLGTLEHKNIPRLIEALDGISCKLIIIGRLDKVTLSHLKIHNIVYENYIGLSLHEIYRHYIDCDIVSFISLYEGFGMPIIEAQAVGRVVITSNIPPMSIVAGNNAATVNPYNVNEIRREIIQIIHDSNYRQNLIQHGLNNAKKYSAAAISKNYLNLYKTL